MAKHVCLLQKRIGVLSMAKLSFISSEESFTSIIVKNGSRTVPLSMARRVCPRAKFVLTMAMLLLAFPTHCRQTQTLYIRPERKVL